MRKKVKLLGFCLVLLLAFSFIYALEELELISRASKQNAGHQNASQQVQQEWLQHKDRKLPQNLQQPAHPSFLTQKELYEVLAKSKAHLNSEEPSNLEEGVITGERVVPEKPRELEGTILAGVVPHHLVAGSLIVEVLAALQPQEPELLIIVGPNHNNLGGRIITGFADWQTPEGLVETEEEIVRILLEKKIAVQDEQVLCNEHSIGSLLPLIKHYLPQAKVVPLIFHHDVTLEEVDKLLAVLAPLLAEDNSVLLASVDFSHYLTRKEAEEKDSFTLKVMNNFDYPTLFHLGNDYLDSPAALATVFRYGQRKGIHEFQLLANTNSGVILQNDYIETTSYFTVLFIKADQS
ncbi:MAG: AmmeMemoRadiSam system protein B [Clostridia bacterium]|jgi:AmmeMemoRadiSam system protein B|nr:AmmeMemoRadiSam system protein B [Clostridia bacterium]